MHDYRLGLSPIDHARLASLTPGQRLTFIDIERDCRARGVFLRVDRAADGPWRQARLWRRSRSRVDVVDQIARLRSKSAPWLASVIESVGPQPSGPWATNAIPGMSWHQWSGMPSVPNAWAIDVIVMTDDEDVDPRADDVTWSPESGYRVWREVATAHGMHRGPERDWAHMQGPKHGAPTMSIADIDRVMRARWEGVGDDGR